MRGVYQAFDRDSKRGPTETRVGVEEVIDRDQITPRRLTRAEISARRAWLTHWRWMSRYHRYEARGIEHLLSVRPALVVGYHGRPIAHDLCMLQVRMLDEHGWMPRAIVHAAAAEIPGLGALVRGMEFLGSDEGSLRNAVEEGHTLIVTPGGIREGCRSLRARHRVDWGQRYGYLALAARYRLPIIPAAGLGVDDGYIGLNDGYAWGKRLGLPGRLPVWLGLGPLGLWPFSPPYPVRMRTVLGPPLRLPEPLEPSAYPEAHGRVIAQVQKMLDAGW